MMKRILMVSALTAALSLFAGHSLAGDRQEQIYGSQMMTPEERAEFTARMRAAETDEEREQIRKEHHEHMKERAERLGVKLPDKPPAGGRGMGPGGGAGSRDGGTGRGMGPGGGTGSRDGGIGPGGGRNR